MFSIKKKDIHLGRRNINKMWNLINTNLYKMRKEKYMLMLIILEVLLAITTIVLNENLKSTQVTIQNVGEKAFLRALGNISVSLIFLSIFLNLHIGNDIQNRTMSMEITRGFTRREVFISKVVSYMIGSTLLMLVYPFTVGVGTTILHGWGGDNSFLTILQKIIVFVLVNLSIVSFCVLVQFMAPISTVSLLINTILVGIGSEIILQIRNRNKLIKEVLDYLPVSKIDFIGYYKIGFMKQANAFLVSVIFACIMLVVAYVNYNKKEFK